MQMMTYDEFINRPLELMQQIEHKIEDVQYKWTLCLNTSQGLSERVQTSPSNTTEIRVIRYAQANKELTELQGKYDEACESVRDFLYGNLELGDADVLDWKYCNGKSINDIAEIRNLSYTGAASRISRAETRARSKFSDLRNFAKET